MSQPWRGYLLTTLLVFLLQILLPVFAWSDLSTNQLNQLGVEAFEAGDTGRAVDYLRQARAAQPYDPQILKNLTNLLLAHGHKLMQEHLYSEAAEFFLEGQEIAPENPRFWLYRAHALLALREYAEAEVEVNEALGMDPEDAVPWALLGRIYYDTGRLREAVSAWEEALARSPEDTGLAGSLAKARRELQVEQEMTQSYGASFVISYDGDTHADLGPELLSVLNEAYVEVGANLDYYPTGQVPVLIYTQEEFSHITQSPGWAAGLYDGKIRIPLGGVTRISPQLRALLYHEYTHVVVRDLARGQCPTWLNEGLAGVAAQSQFDPQLRQLESTQRLFSLQELTGSWKELPVDRVRLAYEQSSSFTGYLIDFYGWYQIKNLLHVFALGATEADAFSEVFSSYGQDLNSLKSDWQESLGRD